MDLESMRASAVTLAGRPVRRFGRATAGLREHPSLLVVGTQRGGTTSMFLTLEQHPGFMGPLHRKGVHYFDVEHHRGDDWYLGHFPLRATVERRRRSTNGPVVVGEATPYYMAHPLAPARMHGLLPDARVVVLLRDPIERAYSAYTHEHARGYDDRPLGRALAEEAEMVERETARLLADPAYPAEELRHNAYLTRGHYADQLRVLESLYGRDQMLVLDSHRLFEDPETEFRRLLDFAGLPWRDDLRFEQHNARPRTRLDADLERRLVDYFEPRDEDLADWLGWRPSWLERVTS